MEIHSWKKRLGKNFTSDVLDNNRLLFAKVNIIIVLHFPYDKNTAVLPEA